MSTTVELKERARVEERSLGVGGSDVAVLLGLYGERAELYQEKVGERERPPDSRISKAKKRAGRIIEAVIAQLYAEETGRKVRRVNETIVHPDFPFIRGNIDRMIVGDARGPGILEAKNTTSEHLAKWEREGYLTPPPYYAQLQHYLFIKGYSWGALAILVDGWDLRAIDVEADPEFQARLQLIETSFWVDLVIPRIPPDPVTVGDVLALFPRSTPGLQVVATAEVEGRVRQLRAVKDQLALLSDLEAVEKELADGLKLVIGGAEALVDSDGRVLATWKSAKDSVKFDEKAFEAAHPELHREFQKKFPGSRRFLLKV